MTHTLGLPVDEGTLGVGGTEDVGTGTCQVSLNVSQHITQTGEYGTMPVTTLNLNYYPTKDDVYLLSQLAPWLGSGQTQNFPVLQKAFPGQSLFLRQVFTLIQPDGLDGSTTDPEGQPHL